MNVNTSEELTTYERMKRMYEHRDCDRVPITDIPWGSTIARWNREGMPEGVSYVDYFGLDNIVTIGADNSPRYPTEVLEENEETVVTTTRWGATTRTWKQRSGVPEFMDFTVTDPDSWAEAKARMTPTRDRIGWDRLERDYAGWRESGAWITAGFWFGFDVTHAHTVGTERLLMAMATDPEWVVDMFNHFLDVDIALFEMVWDAGYEFDAIGWPDDMGYKLHQFFSLQMYRDLLRPVHQRAADWAHEKGAKVHLHSCGDIRPLVPDLIDIGIDMLNPIEVKAGMDPVALKQEHGDRLALHGGLNAVHFGDMDRMRAEMEEVVPVVKESGGYVLSSDHSVPDSVSLEEFGRFVEWGKELGSYE